MQGARTKRRRKRQLVGKNADKEGGKRTGSPTPQNKKVDVMQQMLWEKHIIDNGIYFGYCGTWKTKPKKNIFKMKRDSKPSGTH